MTQNPTSPGEGGLKDLIERLEAADSGSNELDVLIEVALFEPDEEFVACRANNACTKVIYTRRNGSEQTCWAPDYDPTDAAAILRARATNTPEAEGGAG